MILGVGVEWNRVREWECNRPGVDKPGEGKRSGVGVEWTTRRDETGSGGAVDQGWIDQGKGRDRGWNGPREGKRPGMGVQ